jgi:hypothetical protein
MRSVKKKIIANNILQNDYEYYVTQPAGRNFDPEFKPDLSPKEMLELGVFGGHYFLDENARKEFPKSWWTTAKLSESDKKEAKYNFFHISASKPLSYWQEKGWINKQDPHGWFQWYCRYYMGRRSDDDARQIKRWKAFARHYAQVAKNCRAGDIHCRPKQRQALLHWAYDSRKI